MFNYRYSGCKYFQYLCSKTAAYKASMRKLVAMEVVESFEMMEWMHGEDAQDRVLTFFQNNNSIKLKCYFLFFL